MNKTIIIENNIIKEDALDQVSKEVNLGDIVKSSIGILKGLKNITQDILTTIGSGFKLFMTVLDPEKFDKNLENSRRKREKLNSEWERISSNLGIDKPIDEFLQVANPGIYLADKIQDSISVPSYGDDSFLDSLTGTGKPFVDLQKDVFSWFETNDDHRSLSDSKLRSSVSKMKQGDAFLYMSRWEQSLDTNSKNKFNAFKSKNPEDWTKFSSLIARGDPQYVINTLTKRLGLKKKKKSNSNESIVIIHNNNLLVEKSEKESNNKVSMAKEAYVSFLYSIIETNLVIEKQKEEMKKLDDINNLLKQIQEFVDGKNNKIEGLEKFNSQSVGNENETKVSKLIAILSFLKSLKVENYFNKSENKLKTEFVNKVSYLTNKLPDLIKEEGQKIQSDKGVEKTEDKNPDNTKETSDSKEIKTSA